MEQHRAQRVSETIREELSEIIGYEMSDPRIGSLDITEVLISPDMRHARVRLHLAGAPADREATLLALGGARNFLRRELSERLHVYRIPELHFEADQEIDSDVRIGHLLKRARKGRARTTREEQKSTLE